MELFIFVVGVLIGCVFGCVIFKKFNTVGSLRIDSSDPDEMPYLFLELEKDIEHVYRKKYAMFKVNIMNFISHK